MDKVKEYIEKLIKKAGDKQAYYTYGKEYRSTMDKPLYFATIVWSINGLAHYQLKESSQKELLEALKKQYRNMKSTSLAIQYYERQIDFNKESIKYHERMIEAIKNPKKEEDEDTHSTSE